MLQLIRVLLYDERWDAQLLPELRREGDGRMTRVTVERDDGQHLNVVEAGFSSG